MLQLEEFCYDSSSDAWGTFWGLAKAKMSGSGYIMIFSPSVLELIELLDNYNQVAF